MASEAMELEVMELALPMVSELPRAMELEVTESALPMASVAMELPRAMELEVTELEDRRLSLTR